MSSIALADHEFFLPNRSSTRTNPLLVKNELGRSKRCTIDLPPSDFVYGKVEAKDAEGAKEVTLTWKGYQPKAASDSGRDFVQTNKAAIMSGYVDAEEQADFRKNTLIRVRHGSARPKRATEIPDIVFGQSKESVAAAEKAGLISKLVTNAFQEEWIEQRKHEVQEERRKIAEFKKHNLSSPTKASIGHGSKLKKQQEAIKTPFKLKQFDSVGPRVQISNPDKN